MFPHREKIEKELVEIASICDSLQHNLDIDSQLKNSKNYEKIIRYTQGRIQDILDILHEIIGNERKLKQELIMTEREAYQALYKDKRFIDKVRHILGWL